MQKYKLIKEYPTFPKLKIGDIAESTVSESSFYVINGLVYSFDYLLKDYPEFWEKIEEKNYEVLSHKDNFGNIFTKKGAIFSNGNVTYGSNYCDDYFKIHSIKLLPDGEVFTVGDKVNFTHSGNAKYFTINKFKICNDCSDKRIKFIFNEITSMEFPLYSMNNLVRYKEPLFITEDGVEGFEGDRVYIVLSSFDISYSRKLKYRPNYKCFSTKESAEKWVDENKPKYSKKDVLKLISKTYTETLKEYREYIQKSTVDVETFSLIKLTDKINNDKTK